MCQKSLYTRQFTVKYPGGLLGYKRDGGGGGVIFCTQKNTWTLYYAPKRIQVWKSCFRILRELWFELRKNYKPGGNLNQKKYVQIFQTPKKYVVKSSTQKNTGNENFRPKEICWTPPSRLYLSIPPGVKYSLALGLSLP